MIEIKELIEKKEVPMLNEPIATNIIGTHLTQPVNYDQVLTWIKKTPECIGILNALVTDIISDGLVFEPIKKTKGESNVERAETFWRKNFVKEEMKGALFDWLSFGNAALWKGKPNIAQIKEKLSHLKLSVRDSLLTEMKADEDFNRTRILRHVPWTSMNIQQDDYSVTGYVQQVKGKKQVKFSTEEIIHAKLMPIDGRVYGFSPMQAAMSSITTLGLMKDYNGRYFEHGGAPDHMFILPKEMAGSPHVKELKQVLETYNHRMRGNLVFTGEVDVKDINAFNKDMEFRLLAIYHTGILALAFNMPMARLSSILGQEISSNAGSDGLADSGYWRTISEQQDYWETLLNTQLFEPEFGVRIKFNRSYLQDEVREVQIDMVKMDVINKANTELQKYGLKLTEDKLKSYLKLKDEDIEEGELKMMAPTGLNRQNQLNKSQLLSEPSKLAKDESKRKQNIGL